MRSFLTLALLALSACGGTLYTSEGLPALPGGGGAQCTDPAAPMSCDLGAGPVCVAHDRDHCASCSDACPVDPANGSYGCPESVVGAQDWSCRLICNPGWLRTGSGCSRAIAVAAGDSHTCAVAGGLLRCWGANESGQVAGAPSSGPVLVPFDLASGVTLVGAGGTSTCAVVAGSVACWGAVASPSPAITNAAALAVGAGHACALLATGAVQCWGGIAGTPGGTDFLTVTSGASHACALDAAGAVTCWGDNARGQLGGGAAATQSRVVFASGMAAVGAGHDQACAAEAAGQRRLHCWGNDSPPALEPRVNFDAVEIAPGRAHVCVHKDMEPPKCFGDNTLGQLGQAGVAPGDASSIQGALGSYALASGRDHGCALFPDGGVQCWGANAAGQLGGGSTALVAVGTLVPISGR